MEENKIKDLIIYHLNSEAEGMVPNQELEKWINEHPDNKKTFARYQKIWNESPQLLQQRKFDAAKAWNKVNARNSLKVVYRNRIKATVYALGGVAASIVVMLGLSIFTNLFSFDEQYVNVSTEYGSRSEVILPDGSKVKLNAGSTLQYKNNKLAGTRNVIFNGEAFFKVSKSSRPFKIETTDGFNVEVLGTEFNLSAYSEDAKIQTTLFEGSVEVTSAEKAKLELKPGQTAVYNKKSKRLAYGTIDSSHSTGWIEGKVYMDNMSLNELFKKLERWYNIDIQYDEKAAGKYHYTGVLEEKTITDVMNALTKISGIKYTHSGTKILIKELN